MLLEQVNDLDKYSRISLLNQISGIRSANLIGSHNSSGLSNLAIFNSLTHIGAKSTTTWANYEATYGRKTHVPKY